MTNEQFGERETDILEAACRVIAQRGVRGLRVEAIAKEAGVSVALIYYYFASRDGLVSRVQQFANQRARHYTRVQHADTPRDMVEQILLHEIQDDPAVRENVAVWAEVRASSIFNTEQRDAVKQTVDEWIRAIATLIRQAQAAGEVSPRVDADASAARLTALSEGLSSRWLCGNLTTDQARVLMQGALALELSPSD